MSTPSDSSFDAKTLFNCLSNYEYYPAILPIIQGQLAKRLSAVDLDSIPDEDKDDADTVLSRMKETDFSCLEFEKIKTDRALFSNREPLDHHSINEESIELNRLIPTLLAYPCWLQSIANANLAHRRDSAHLFKLFIDVIARHSPYQKIRREFSAGNVQCTLTDISTHETPDWVYLPPLTYLGLARFSASFLSEILGFTLAEVIKPITLRFSTILSIAGIDAENADRRKPIFDRSLVLKAIQQHLLLENPDDAWPRIRSGLLLNFAVHHELAVNIESERQNTQTLDERVIKIFKGKAPYAVGYHGGIQLGEKPLDDWFGERPFEGRKFLHALSKSDYFDTNRPDKSRFFTELTAFDGPMFGIFSKAELTSIRQWLSGDLRTEMARSNFDATKPTSVHRTFNTRNSAASKSTRTLYYQLLNVEQHPDVFPEAHRYLEKSFAKTKRYLFFRKAEDTIGKFEYNPQVFHQFIERLYRREVEKHQEIKTPPKLSKSVYRWGIRQFAPTVLTDGSWLQRTGTYGTWDNPIVRKLFRIFADEIGNGFHHQNHANVYRKLLASLDIPLPDFDANEFATNRQFLDAAFDIPAYFLAISEFQKIFLPEIMGLNLAIELSGLGSGYRALARNLEYWAIDSQIVRLHQSIDNLASGHAAIARDVIIEYLDQILSVHGFPTMKSHWRRIGLGYYSLTVVPRRFKWALIGVYFHQFLLPRSVRSLTSRQRAVG